jgi:hypothetical protein
MTTAARLKAAKTWSDLIATWVTIGGALVGGIWALHEYSDKIHDDEVAATLRYEQRYNATPLWDIRSRLEAFWSPRTSEVMDAANKADDALSDYVLKALAGDKVAHADTMATIDFFAGLGACLCAGLCDSPTAIQVFGREADDFYELNHSFIITQRQQLRDDTYAAGVAAVASAFTSGQKAIDKAACTSFN